MRILTRLPVLLLICTTVLAAEPAAKSWTLEDCVTQALASNKDYQIAGLTVKKRKAEERAAFAGLLPALSFSGTYTKLNEGVTVSGFPMAYEHNTSLGLTLNYPIPLIPYLSDGAWGMASKAHDIAKENLKLAGKELDKIRIKTRAMVAKQFYMVLLNQQTLDVTRSNQARLKAYVDAARRNFQAGRVSQYELLRTQVQLANNTPLLLQSENHLQMARVTLLQTMGLSLDTKFILKGTLELSPVEMTEKQALTTALKYRYEFSQIAANERILKATLALQKYARRPILAAFGNLSWDQAGERFLSGGFENSWNVGLSLSFPVSELFPWSKTKHTVKAADLDLSIIRKTRHKTEDMIRLEIRQILLRLNEHTRTIAAQKVAVRLSRQGLRIARVRYNNGQMGNVELMDAELDYQRAQMNLFSARYQYVSAVYDLLQAIGVEQLIK